MKKVDIMNMNKKFRDWRLNEAKSPNQQLDSLMKELRSALEDDLKKIDESELDTWTLEALMGYRAGAKTFRDSELSKALSKLKRSMTWSALSK
jgi:hypothetical protein